MANINIENISDLALNGNDLFNDSESFITELDENEEGIIGGYGGCGFTNLGNCDNTIVVGNCDNTLVVGG